MEGVRELEAFAAVVYSSAFELENPGGGLDQGGRVEEKEAMPAGSVIGDEPAEEIHEDEAEAEGEAAGASIVAKAWSGFEGVWRRVAGGGSGQGQAPLTG